MAYEDGYHKACDDIACPANSRPSSETIRAKNPYNGAKTEVQPVSNNNSPTTNSNTQPKVKIEEKPAVKPNQNK